MKSPRREDDPLVGLIERLRAGARQFQFSGNEEEELAQAATEAADALEELGQRPIAWAVMHCGVPAQATTDEPTAIRWRKAGGDVIELVRRQHPAGMPQFARATTQEEP